MRSRKEPTRSGANTDDAPSSEQLLASLSRVVVGLRGDGAVSTWPSSATKLLGLTAEQVLGLPFRLLDAEGRVQRRGAEPSWRSERTTRVGYLRRGDTQLQKVHVIISPIGQDGEKNGYVAEVEVVDRESSQLESAAPFEQGDPRWRAIFDAGVDASFVIDETGTILDANPAVRRVLHYQREELLGRNINVLVPEPDRQRHDFYLRRYCETGQARIIGIGREVLAERADGTTIAAELAVSEGEHDGKRIFVGNLRDISERKAAEREAAKLKNQLTQAIETLHAGFVMYDEEDRLIICNRRYVEMYRMPEDLNQPGLSYEEILRGTLLANPEVYGVADDEAALEEFVQTRLKQLRNPEPTTLQQLDGRWIRIDERRTPVGTVSLRTDVTKLKEAEYNAKVQEERLRLAATAGEVGIWEYDLDSGRVHWDERMLNLHGYDKEGFPGTFQAWKDRIFPEDLPTTEALLRQCIEKETEFRETFRIRLPGGEVRHVAERGTLMKDPRGRATHLLGVTLDVTEHFEATARLEEALDKANEATRAKAEFLATMSHEIRTPMNAVIGMTDLLNLTALDAEQREYAQTIRSAGENLLSLINDILDFSKMEAGKLQLESISFPLTRLTHEVANMFTDQAEKKGIDLICQAPQDEIWLEGDPTRIRQVLLNLLSNAVKFTATGQVALCTEVVEGSGDQACVRLVVEDTGLGMSKEHLARLGEAFAQADASTTRRFGGTGLGISICKSLVALMRGTIDVESTQGKGTKFAIELPLKLGSAPLDATDELERTRSDPTPRLRVLVAEDNKVNQRVVALMLKDLAESVDLVENGAEAVEKMREKHYDCVLMDGQMPVMDGLEATRRIRSWEKSAGQPRTPIIALTANALPGDRDTFLAAGMNEYLSKPVRALDLKSVLWRVVLGQLDE